MVFQGQPRNLEAAFSQIGQETPLGVGAAALADQIVYFGGHWCWNHERSRLTFEKLTDGGMARIAFIPKRD